MSFPRAPDIGGHRVPTPNASQPAQKDHQSVRIGDQVSFEYLDNPGDVLTFQIGEGAAKQCVTFLTISSPLAKAMLGRAVGETGNIIIGGHCQRKLKVTAIIPSP